MLTWAWEQTAEHGAIMMGKELRIECQKMIKSRTLAFSILFGVAISMINVIENFTLKQWFLDVPAKMPGYATLSIFTNWIDGSQGTAGEMIFFTVFPLLASLPFSWSLLNEKASGYTNHILTRSTRINYLSAKFIAVFLSGGIVISTAMCLNFAINAWVLPVTPTTPQLIASGDSYFLSVLLINSPIIYVVIRILTGFVWGGILACLSLVVSLFLHNTVLTVLSSFILMFGGSILSETLSHSTSGQTGHLETSPLQLLHGITFNYNPAWYVWTIMLGLLAIELSVYFVRGTSDEMV